MPIIVACACGKRLQAPDTLAGKRTKCPVCGGPIQVPLPNLDAGNDDPLGLGDLSQYEPHAQMPPGYPAPGYPAQYDPLAGGAMPAANYGWQQQPAAGYGWPQQAPAKKGNLGIILAIVGGVAAALLLLLGVGAMIAISVFSGGSNEVAQGDSAIPPPPPAPYQPVPPVEPPPSDSTDADEQTDEQTDDGGGDASIPTTDVPMPPDTPAAPEEDPEPPEPVLPSLDEGLEKWRAAAGASGLKGAYSSPDASHIIEHHSWQTKLLPYLGHDELYRKLKFDKSWTEGASFQAAHTVVPQFLNPADDRRTWKGYPYEGVALTHFVGMSGVEDKRNVVAAMLPRSDNRAGMFGYDQIAAPAEITDGLSQTIMVLGSGELIGPWAQGGGATIRGAREPYFDSITGFGSRGLTQPGTMAVFADGSVREISAGINPRVFRAMCTIHGADTVDKSQLDRPLEQLPFRIEPMPKRPPTTDRRE